MVIVRHRGIDSKKGGESATHTKVHSRQRTEQCDECETDHCLLTIVGEDSILYRRVALRPSALGQ